MDKYYVIQILGDMIKHVRKSNDAHVRIVNYSPAKNFNYSPMEAGYLYTDEVEEDKYVNYTVDVKLSFEEGADDG